MKIYLILILSFLLMAAKYSPMPITHLGKTISVEKKIFTVPKEGKSLKRDTTITSDEVIIDGPLITNGFRLTIDTARLEFKESGLIKAFTESDISAGKVGRGQSGPKGARVEDMIHRSTPGLPGNQGGDGETGPVGIQGMKNPGEIKIFTSELIGTPNINGKGEKGGSGGKGGNGGQGGKGGKGGSAWCMPFNSGNGGPGGKGGPGGRGGKGGTGGQGGDSVPVQLSVGFLNPGIDLSKVISAPGDGGSGGAPGRNGFPGLGGDGGSPASCNQIIHVRIRPRGASGEKNEENTGNLGEGETGDPGTQTDNNLVIEKFNDLESQRIEVINSWLEFHWRRTFYLLLSDSIDFLEDIKIKDAVFPEELSIYQQLFSDIIQSWKNFFIIPLQQTSSDEKDKPHFAILKKKASLIVMLLLMAPNKAHPLDTVLEKIHDFESLARDELQKSIDHAIDSCRVFNGTKLNLTQNHQFLASTIRYIVPVCDGSVNFLKNPLEPIQLVRRMDSKDAQLLELSSATTKMLESVSAMISEFSSLNTNTTNCFPEQKSDIDFDLLNKDMTRIAYTITQCGFQPKNKIDFLTETESLK